MGRAVHPHIITPDSALGGLEIGRSVRCGNAGGFTRTPSVTGNQKVWTWSGWTKRWSTGGSHTLFSSEGNNDGIAAIYFNNDNIHTYFDTSGANPYGAVNNRLYRDPHSWMHVVWQVDALNTDQRIWINGQEESITSSNDPPNYAYSMNEAGKVNGLGISAYGGGQGQLYLAEVHHSDGYKYDPSYYGYTDPQTGIWRPKKVTGISYGTNGFYLDFSDNSAATAAALGKDRSGNGNDWTPNGSISVANDSTNDSLLDTPTNNFAIISPLAAYENNYMAPDHGGLNFSLSNNLYAICSHIIPDSGKWYAECVWTDVQTGDIGVFNAYRINDNSQSFDGRWNGIVLKSGGYIRVDNTQVQSGLTAISAGAVIGILIDRDAGTVSFTNNGAANGTPVLLSAMYFQDGGFTIRAGRNSSSGSNPAGYFNFGQRPFSYLPSGYRSLCDKNMTTPIGGGVVDPKKHFNVVTYAGNSNNSREITVGFQPDLVWMKNRGEGGSDGTSQHMLFDSMRIDPSNSRYQFLGSNNTSTDATNANGLQAFTTSGFKPGSMTRTNESGDNYVAWCWKAGGAAVTNNDGTIATQVSVNKDAGFSIITYTGTGADATIGHGLGRVPAWVIIKNRDRTVEWIVKHKSLDTGKVMYLNLNDVPGGATGSNNGIIGDLNNASTFSLSRTSNSGNYNNVNVSSEKFVAYCWAEIPGYSKFGIYMGNSDANGTYVPCGFRPAWLMIKRTTGSDPWLILDATRDTDNVVQDNVYANSNDSEFNTDALDFVSNGFKWRIDSGLRNDTGDKYIFMAFAEQPGFTPYMAPTNAR